MALHAAAQAVLRLMERELGQHKLVLSRVLGINMYYSNEEDAYGLVVTLEKEQLTPQIMLSRQAVLAGSSEVKHLAEYREVATQLVAAMMLTKDRWAPAQSVIHRSSLPPTRNVKVGDLWVGDDMVPRRWDGKTWSASGNS